MDLKLARVLTMLYAKNRVKVMASMAVELCLNWFWLGLTSKIGLYMFSFFLNLIIKFKIDYR